MELSGLNQNLMNVSKVDPKSTQGNTSQVSNDSSDRFQKTLDRFSKNSDSSKQSSDNQSKEFRNNSYDSKGQEAAHRSSLQGQSTAKRSSLPGQDSGYRKPIQNQRPIRPNTVPGAQQGLRDEAVASKMEDNNPQGEASPKVETVDSLTRRAAIQTFMQKMETRLGVEPSEIVDAFQQLSMQELAAPPEQNVEKIISFLNLNPQDEDTARNYFNDMLAQSSANSIAEYLKSTDRELSLSVLSDNQLRQERLQKGLAKMNEQFFAQPQVQKQADQNNESVTPEMLAAIAGAGAVGAGAVVAQSEAGQAAASATSTDASSIQNFFAKYGDAIGSPTTSSSQVNAPNSSGIQSQQVDPSINPSDSGQALLGDGWESASDNPSYDAADLEKLVMNSKNNLGKNAYGLNSAPTPSPMKLEAFESASNVTSSGSESGFELSGFAAASNETSENLDSDTTSDEMNQHLSEMVDAGELAEADGMDFQVKSEAAATAAGQTQNTTTSKAPGFILGHQPTEAEQAQNVKEVVTQANLLVKNGGGEMKVTLNPEGMGQVNLKVAVNDGQVAVEMVTESDEAKKILEKGLGELKATLASHKLNVDHVKVDLAGEVMKQFDHAHDEAQRQSAQNFMEQFRNQNQSWRQSFFDVPGGRSSRHPNEAGPQDELTQVQSSSNKKSASRRLDLVA